MAIQVGDRCPAFALHDQHGNLVSSEGIIGNKLIVLYFYPKDNSGGCTAEACSFRDAYEEFKDAGCEVIGVSSDSIESHKQFAAKNRLTFTLLADEGAKLRKAFGVPRTFFGIIAGRVTYIIDKQGVIRHIHNSLTNTESHITESLNIIRSITDDFDQLK